MLTGLRVPLLARSLNGAAIQGFEEMNGTLKRRAALSTVRGKQVRQKKSSSLVMLPEDAPKTQRRFHDTSVHLYYSIWDVYVQSLLAPTFFLQDWK